MRRSRHSPLSLHVLPLNLLSHLLHSLHLLSPLNLLSILDAILFLLLLELPLQLCNKTLLLY